MQKSKLLLEPKQKTNSEKKEKIKSTISQKQNWKQILCKIQEFWKDGNLETVNKI